MDFLVSADGIRRPHFIKHQIMKTQQRYIRIGILIAAILTLIVIGSGAYFVMHQNSRSAAFSEEIFDDSQTPSTTSDHAQPIVQPSVAASTSSPAIHLKTYTNAKFGYSIQYPDGWIVDPEQAIIDTVNKIPSVVEIHTADNNKRLSILINEREWLLKHSTSFKQPIAIGEAQHTAYMFPRGHECGMADHETIDCSFFVVPIFYNGMWYELHAMGGAQTVTNEWRSIVSSFRFTTALPTYDD